MGEGIYLSYDTIITLIITILLAIISWLIIYFSKLNRRIHKLEIDNSALKTSQKMFDNILKLKKVKK